MQKILHIGKYYPPYRGGMEEFLQVLLRGLAENGSSQRALVHQHGGSSSRERDGEIEIIRSRTFGRLLFVPLAPFFLWHLYREIRDYKPDLIHLHMPNASALWLLLPLPGFWRCPWVVHWHSDVVFPARKIFHRLAYGLYRPLERRLLSRAAAIIVTSPPYLEHSEALRPFRDKCRVIPLTCESSPVPDEAAADTGSSGPDTGALKLLCVGRLTHYKGQGVLVAAVSKLVESGCKVELVLAGGGENYESLRRQVAELGLEDTVLLKGQVGESELEELFLSCDLLCLPSLERSEAFGLVLLEAMARSKPALVTAVVGSGMSWVVEDGVTGWVVEPGNAAQLAERLHWCQQHPEELKRAGRTGGQRYQDTFSREKVVADTIELYSELL